MKIKLNPALSTRSSKYKRNLPQKISFTSRNESPGNAFSKESYSSFLENRSTEIETLKKLLTFQKVCIFTHLYNNTEF